MIEQWIKSSYSGHEGNCVELATTWDRLRDSKDPAGPVLEAVKQGRFDR